MPQCGLLHGSASVRTAGQNDFTSCCLCCLLCDQIVYEGPKGKRALRLGLKEQRLKKPAASRDPIEIDLVFNVRRCGTCAFFWPEQPMNAPYGPFPSYDFESDTPVRNIPPDSSHSFPWLTAITNTPSFPDPEIMDGCRKAPIMTMGINPNLTAFAPGRTGATWCYPNFSSDKGTDAWTKYAYYYRYRTVYQERFDLRFVRQFLLDEGRIVAAKPGVIISAERLTDDPSYELKVLYDGEQQATRIALPGQTGAPRYVLLFDSIPPDNRFKQGDLIAARLKIPSGKRAQVYGQQINYYEQFAPTLRAFESFLRGNGHPAATLRMGEDVCQLDMVACASPHWGTAWLGGTNRSEAGIIENCVARNAWAMKQLLQTRPAVLFLVGEASYVMFREAFGRLIEAQPSLPERPEDGAFTLLRVTTDLEHPSFFRFAGRINDTSYAISVRLVVVPHFSYSTNYISQFRLSQDAWNDVQRKFPRCSRLLMHDGRVKFHPASGKNRFVAVLIEQDERAVLEDIRATETEAYEELLRYYYNPHAMMTRVLRDLYTKRQLAFISGSGTGSGFLARTEGPCSFCVNTHWEFPLGCPYGKPAEKQLPIGFLEIVAAQIAKTGGIAKRDFTKVMIQAVR